MQFRLGSGSLNRNDSHIRSDTLFSGLATVWAAVYGDVAELVEWFGHKNDPKLCMSSGFYALEHYVNEELRNTMYFLPKPLIGINTEEYSDIKTWKNIEYISLGVYRQIRQNKLRPDGFGAFVTTADVLSNVRIAHNCLCTQEEYDIRRGSGNSDTFISTITVPKVHVHKTGDKDALYSETNLRFNDISLGANDYLRGHFYVLLRHSLPENDWKRVRTCFRILAEEGIGGERSSGKGKIEELAFQEAPEEFRSVMESGEGYYMALSMISPRLGEEKRLALYKLSTRGSWTLGVQGDLRRHRKQVRLVCEGALLSAPVCGKVVTVTPSQGSPYSNIYRNGTCFSIPIQ